MSIVKDTINWKEYIMEGLSYKTFYNLAFQQHPIFAIFLSPGASVIKLFLYVIYQFFVIS